MGRPEEIQKRHLGDENNCDASVISRATGRAKMIEAHIPVFAGAVILAALDTREDVAPGDEVRRLPDGKLFSVRAVLGREKGGRLSVELTPL